jgi:hypothetical protein
MPKIVVEFLDDAAFEAVERLPEPHCEVAWDLLDHLQDAPHYGKPLETRIATGDLSGALSLYVIDFEQKLIDWPPEYRIVYRLLPDDTEPTKAQVIWAGRRDDLEVYRVAARRLSREG